MSISRLSQESTHCQLSSCGFELPACGEQESNYSIAPFSQLFFMETVLSGSRVCLAKYSLIKLWLAAPEVKQEIYPTPLRSHRKQNAGRLESVKIVSRYRSPWPGLWAVKIEVALLTSIQICCSEVRNFMTAKAYSQAKLSSRVVVLIIKLQTSWLLCLTSNQKGICVFTILPINFNYLLFPSVWERRSMKRARRERNTFLWKQRC